MKSKYVKSMAADFGLFSTH